MVSYSRAQRLTPLLFLYRKCVSTNLTYIGIKIQQGWAVKNKFIVCTEAQYTLDVHLESDCTRLGFCT